jgi:predicted NBD/HSP70 family sugar kinase
MPTATRALVPAALPTPDGKPRHLADVPAWSAWLAEAGMDGVERAFAAILTGEACSRSALSTLLKVRSTTVSAWVGAMVRAQLVVELQRKREGRGRPLAELVANPDRLATSVLMVHSQSLHIVTVNLLGRVLWHESAAVPAGAGNADVRRTLRALQQRAASRLDAGTRLVGVVFSLSGLVSAARAQWVFASRWPGIRKLALRDCTAVPHGPMQVVRNMDAQLQARYLRREQVGPARRTLLLHWGYGIGVTFGPVAGASTGSTEGFGEVGHWQLPHQRLTCRCGHVGCLETVAALWAIGPHLLGARFDDAMDEVQAAELLQAMALTRHAVFNRALEEVVRVLVNLCRLFFPAEVIVSGPFIENAGAWDALSKAFLAQDLLVDSPMPRLERQRVGHQLEQEGAAMPVLLQGLREILRDAMDGSAQERAP